MRITNRTTKRAWSILLSLALVLSLLPAMAVAAEEAHVCSEGELVDHCCDICWEPLEGLCAEGEAEDHLCDICWAPLKDLCVDVADADGWCDLCGLHLNCADIDEDHQCDQCYATLSECSDEGHDHWCDLCGMPCAELVYAEHDQVCAVCGAYGTDVNGYFSSVFYTQDENGDVLADVEMLIHVSIPCHEWECASPVPAGSVSAYWALTDGEMVGEEYVETIQTTSTVTEVLTDGYVQVSFQDLPEAFLRKGHCQLVYTPADHTVHLPDADHAMLEYADNAFLLEAYPSDSYEEYTFTINGLRDVDQIYFLAGDEITIALNEQPDKPFMWLFETGEDSDCVEPEDKVTTDTTTTFTMPYGKVSMALGSPAYALWVAGTQVVQENLTDVLGDGTVSFDPESCTLTLKDAEIVNEYGHGIYAYKMDLTVNGTGESSITAYTVVEAEEDGTVYYPGHGIYVEGSSDGSYGRLKLTGTLGNITIHGSGDGLSAYYGVEIDGTVGKISCLSEDADLSESFAGSCLGSDYGDIIIDGTVGDLYSGSECVDGNKDILIHGTVGKITAGITGIRTSGGNVTIDGTVGDIICGHVGMGGCGIEAYASYEWNDDAEDYLPMYGDVTISGKIGKIRADICTIYADGKLTLNVDQITLQYADALNGSLIYTGSGIVNPSRAGYSFGGWFADKDYKNEFDFAAPVEGEVTVYAKWVQNPVVIPAAPTFRPAVSAATGGKVTLSHNRVKAGDSVTITVTPDAGMEADQVIVTDEEGNPVEVIDNGDGTFTFIQPKGDVTVSATFKEETPAAAAFTDLAPEAWYYPAVEYVLDKGLMNGISDNTFAPEQAMDRATMVTILWCLAGEPVVNYAMNFADVDQDAWYSEAVRWAAAEGIINGYGDGRFGINDPATREQAAAMLYRYIKKQGNGFVGSWMFLLDCTDRADVASWAYESMCWMHMKGIYHGYNSKLMPKDALNRAQAAQMLMNYLEQ